MAANKLDVSESMLCKRFKEITNRKWPYRFVAKLEKEIEICKEEKVREELIKQKNILLVPVSIRVRRYRYQKEIDDLGYDTKENVL